MPSYGGLPGCRVDGNTAVYPFPIDPTADLVSSVVFGWTERSVISVHGLVEKRTHSSSLSSPALKHSGNLALGLSADET